MKVVKILIPIRRLPHLESLDLMISKNIIAELEKKIKIEIIWLVIIPNEKSCTVQKQNERIIFFQSHNNAVDVMDEINPDLVFLQSSFEPIKLSVILACKSKKIPLATSFIRAVGMSTKQQYNPIITNLRVLLSKKIRGDSESKDSKRFNGLRFYLIRLKFLLKTISKCKNRIGFVLFCLLYIKANILSLDKIHSILSGDLNLCSLEKDLDILNKNGINSSKIKIVGNPAFDELYHKINNQNQPNITTEKIRVLFCPPPLHEHGYWSTSKEFHLINSVINKVLKNKNVEINIKIHPTSSFMDEYKTQLLQNIHRVKIFQKEDVIELFFKHDLVISYDGTSAILMAVLCKKPIIYLKINGIKPSLFENDLSTMIECNNTNDIINKIKKIQNVKIDERYLEKYIKKHIGYFDGKCSKRASEYVLKLLHVEI
jgi:hypothetical protein